MKTLCPDNLRSTLLTITAILGLAGIAQGEPIGQWPGYPEQQMEAGMLYRVTPKSMPVLFVSMKPKPSMKDVLGRDYDGVERFWLVAADRHHVLQEIPGSPGCRAEDVQIGDFNFDSYTDFRLYDKEESGKGCRMYHHFLFNPQASRFEPSTHLDKLCGVHFDHQTKQVIGTQSMGGGIHSYSWYRWVKSKLELIREATSNRTEAGRMYTDITVRLPSGKLRKTRHYVDEEG